VPVYLSHFIVSLALAIVLWCINYPLFKRYLTALVTLTVAALTTYLLYPAAPPWMAALNGRLPEIHRVVQETLATLGGQTLNSAVEKGAAYSNPVAAMPSLHAAIPMMLLLFFWPEVRVRGRVFLATYAGLMSFALVYGGEHYVTDVVLGWVYAALTVFGLRAVANWRTDRAAAAAAEDPVPVA
jgi:membrane-associated phospholipid phosphatase